MKTLLYSAVLIAVLLIPSGCDNLLEEKVVSGVTSQYYESEEGMRDLVNSCYYNLRWYGSAQAFLAITQFGTDNWWRSPEDKPLDMYNAGLNSFESENDQVWSYCYSSIYSANLIIFHLPIIEKQRIFKNPVEYNQALGEAYFFRAFHYFRLVQNFGAVPLELSAAPGELKTSYKRSPVSNVYQQVIGDFRKAVELLQNMDKLQYGKISKQAAQHFLSKAYLNKASATSAEEKTVRGWKATDADSTAFYAQQLIDFAESTGYLALEKNFADVYNVKLANQELNGPKAPETDQASKERIFIVQYTKNTLLNGYGDGSTNTLPFGGENAQSAWFSSEYDRIPGIGGRQLEYGRSWNKISPTAHLFDTFGYRTTGTGPAAIGTENDNNQYDSRMYKSFRFAFKAWDTNAGKMPKWDNNANGWNYNSNPALVGKARYNTGDTAVVLTVQRIPSSTLKADAYKTKYYIKTLTQIATAEGATESISDLKAYFPNLMKHMDPNRISSNDTKGSRDVVLARLGETYLLAAEGYARANNLAKAVQYVNVVRRRAAYHDGEQKPYQVWKIHGGLNNTTNTEKQMEITVEDITGTEKMVNFFLDERERELAGEFHRWNDLNRCEKLIERTKAYNIGQASQLIQSYHKYRPVPQNHIDRLTNADPISEEQNQGYY